MVNRRLTIPVNMRGRLRTSLRKLRNGQGLSQEKMGARYGIAKSTWGGYEQGTSFPSIRLLIWLHIDYGLSLDYALGVPRHAFHGSESLMAHTKRKTPIERIPV